MPVSLRRLPSLAEHARSRPHRAPRCGRWSKPARTAPPPPAPAPRRRRPDRSPRSPPARSRSATARPHRGRPATAGKPGSARRADRPPPAPAACRRMPRPSRGTGSARAGGRGRLRTAAGRGRSPSAAAAVSSQGRRSSRSSQGKAAVSSSSTSRRLRSSRLVSLIRSGHSSSNSARPAAAAGPSRVRRAGRLRHEPLDEAGVAGHQRRLGAGATGGGHVAHHPLAADLLHGDLDRLPPARVALAGDVAAGRHGRP